MIPIRGILRKVFYGKNGRVSYPKTIIIALTAPPLLFVLTAFVFSLTDIRIDEHSPSWIILDRNYRFIAEIESPRGEIGYWPMPDTLPQTLVTAVLAAEDHRFRKHIGIDLKSVGRAFVNNYIHRKGFSGASTIAMQTARLQRGGRGNLFSKVRDSFAAVWLTLFYGRERVLRQYVSISPYGNRIAGAPCASRRYFRKPVQDLSLAESALLVSIPRAPGRMNVFNQDGFAAARSRAFFVLARCAKYGWIDSTEYLQSTAELKEFIIPPKDIRDEASIHVALRYTKILHSAVLGIDGKGINNSGINNNGINNRNVNGINNISINDTDIGDSVINHGLVVSSIDIDLQQHAQRELADHLDQLRTRDVENGAVVVLDKNTRQVLAYVGSGGYFSFDNGMLDYAAIKRSTGSLMKPFIFALGMEDLGYTAATVLKDINYDFGEGTRSFIPVNSDRQYHGPILYKYALANSRNIPAVQLMKELGINKVYGRLCALKLADNDGRADYYGLGLSIGGLYCDLTSIARAYMTLGNDGRFGELAWFRDQTDQYKQTNQRKQVFTTQSARMIQRFLSDPQARLPTFPREGNFEYPFATAVKTGTSEGFRDAWCVAWSSRYLVATWVGNADNRPMKRVTGYEGAAPLVKKILLHLHPNERDGLYEGGFPVPDGWNPFSICRLTGTLANENTPYVTSDYFAPGTEPTEKSAVLRLLPVDKRNGLLANQRCPKRYVEHRQFLSLSPEYEQWGRAYGLPIAPRLHSTLCPGGESLPIDYALEITWPRSGARFFTDPEAPPDQAFLPVNCVAEPEAPSLLWFVNGEEHTVTTPPHTLRLPFKSGKYTVQAEVAGTPVRSKAVRFEVY